MIRLLSAFFLTAGLFLSPVQAEQWSYSYPATERDNFVSADFLLNLDSGITSPRGIIVLVGAQDVDMRKSVISSPWARVAKQQGAAVLGCKFVNKADGDFSRVDSGSRSALLACVRELAKQSEALRDLDRLKMVVVGRLAGAQFTYEFANRESDRVAGFICIDPYYFNTPPTGGLRKTPGFFMVEENVHPIAAASVKKIFEEQRRYGALWARAFWDNTKGRDLDLAMAATFMEQTLIVRIDRKYPINAVEDFTLNKGWCMDLSQMTTPAITESKNVARGKEADFAWFSTELQAETVAKILAPPEQK